MTVLTATTHSISISAPRGDAPTLGRRPVGRQFTTRAEVPVDALVFTATNRRGLIIEANSTFTDLTGYTRSRLLGAPHNLIRHPEMPGGAFRTIWNQLHTQSAATGYVQDLTSDGRAYWTFAAFTPGGGGHLAIRQRPCSPILPAVTDLYERACGLEQGLRARGSSAAEAAQAGEQSLIHGVRGLRFDGYHQFVLETLPAEVAIRAALGGGLTGVRGGRGPAGQAVRVENRVQSLALSLYANRGDDTELARLIEDAVQNAAALNAALRHRPEPTGQQGEPGPFRQVQTVLATLAEDAVALEGIRHRLRCGASLAQMQAEMIGRYLMAVADGAESPHSCGHAVERLTDALHGWLAEISEEVRLLAGIRGRLDAFTDAVGAARQNLDSLPDGHEPAHVLTTADTQHRNLRALTGRLTLALGGFDPGVTGKDVLEVDEAFRRDLG